MKIINSIINWVKQRHARCIYNYNLTIRYEIECCLDVEADTATGAVELAYEKVYSWAEDLTTSTDDYSERLRVELEESIPTVLSLTKRHNGKVVEHFIDPEQ